MRNVRRIILLLGCFILGLNVVEYHSGLLSYRELQLVSDGCIVVRDEDNHWAIDSLLFHGRDEVLDGIEVFLPDMYSALHLIFFVFYQLLERRKLYYRGFLQIKDDLKSLSPVGVKSSCVEEHMLVCIADKSMERV